MHNNGYLDRARSATRPFYTAVEAGVLWARAEGAKTASDPRIEQYTQYILEALQSGNLAVQNAPDTTADKSKAVSRSSPISFDALKEWMMKYYPKAKPAFLFAKDV